MIAHAPVRLEADSDRLLNLLVYLNPSDDPVAAYDAFVEPLSNYQCVHVVMEYVNETRRQISFTLQLRFDVRRELGNMTVDKNIVQMRYPEPAWSSKR